MDEEKIEAIGKALRTERHRVNAINLISKINPLPQSLATAWINDIVYALDTETGAYNKFQILKQLKRLAQEHPSEAVVAVPSVAKEVNNELRNSAEEDLSSNTKVNWGTEILQYILEGTDASEARFDIHPRDINAFLNYGGSEHRSLGYRLLGRSATPEAVRKLTRDDISYELELVVSSYEEAIKDACTIVLDFLSNDENITTTETIVSFSELYSADVLEPDSQTLEYVRNQLLNLLRTEDRNEKQLLSVIVEISKENKDFAKVIGEEAFKLLDGDSSDQYVAWRILSRVAECTPIVVLNRSDKLIQEITANGSDSTLEGLKIVSILGRHGPAVPADLAKATICALKEEERDIVIAAVEAVSTIDFYPPPDPLMTLAEGNDKVGKAASKAIDELLKRERDRLTSSDRKFQLAESEVSLFKGDRGRTHLKQRTRDGFWADLDLSKIRMGTVKETVMTVNRDENVPVVFPYYEPRDVVLLAIALVLSDTKAKRQIGIYSPGSRAHWGMKGEIRDELNKFALSNVAGEVVNAVPIPNIVPHAYVWDKEVKNDSRGDGPGRFILCKELHDLEYVSDLDVILLNLTSRTKEDLQERLRDVEEKHPQATFVNAYSYYVKNERDGRPRYGPPLGLDSISTVPGLNTIDTVLQRSNFNRESYLSESAPADFTLSSLTKCINTQKKWSLGEDDIRSLADAASIRIDHVKAKDISSLLDQVFKESASLRGVDDGGAGGMIFSRQLFFERLPVPGKDFDEWVRERYYRGEWFVPPLINERIGDIEERAGTVENLQAVRPLNRSVRIFQQIDQRLREQNPLFDKLKEYIRDTRENDQRLAIFSESPKHAEILKYSLLKQEVVTQDELDTGFISVVSPDEARGMDVHDILVVFGVLHRENAAFYIHPRVSETLILTYDRTWATMVERHAREFVETLNDVVGGSNSSPYLYPELLGDTEQEPVDETSNVESTGGSVVADGDSQHYKSGSLDPASSAGQGLKTKVKILADAMEAVSSREYREESGRYEREIRHYIVKTEFDKEIKLTNYDRILCRRPNNSKVEYHWVSPEALTSGDTIVTIPDEIERELWREQLRNLYENEVNADQAINRLTDWYEALQEIWRRIEEDLSTTEIATDSKIHEVIFENLEQSNDNFERTKPTVQTWFNSVLEADGPLNLVKDPSLTIGPRSYSDIEAIGRAFKYDRLSADAKEIEAAMEGLRTINRQQGHELHDAIREQMNTSKSTHVREAAEQHVVKDIKQINNEFNSN
ncbi:hypothetical protein HAPAU_35580 [Halalkalicoccus paucihalophilus]|uniref:Uncharacterized protein n=1 Tax=Halalkalicoccus paucihalophilus TaxID=1008153 RepID=A0A151AAB0_9EURY|nr:hypothetical protein [Halalkalicoccus paucihalophilus]KYH24575.1 hypothetical protein HAPAU_35580 [Halalkalicoccus paucihalophilus]